VREIKKTLSKIGDNLEDNRIRVAVLEAIQRGENVQRER